MAAATAINTRSIKIINVSSPRNARIPYPISLLQMCRSSHEVKQLHAQLIVSGLFHHPLNPGRLVESYVLSSDFGYASLVFESIPCPDIFAYNTMIRCLMLGPEFPNHQSLLLYQELLSHRLKPDNHTFTFVLKTCALMKAISEGKQLHGQMIKSGIQASVHTKNSLIHMYSKCGDMESAHRVLFGFADDNVLAMNSIITGYFNGGQVKCARVLFDRMNDKDAATWNAMIAGYTSCDMHAEALSSFREMMANGVQLNESTLVIALSACAHLGALDQGKWIHKYIEKNNVEIGVKLRTAIIDMYAKCGCIHSAYEVFRNTEENDVVTWGAMISGFSIHGDEMVESVIMPNEVIFVAIISGCSHKGFAELGFRYFNQMVHKYGISASIEHYGCLADLLGRAGRLSEAEELISCMPERPNSVIWGALLSSCIFHHDMMRGQRALKELVKLGTLSADRYKQVRNFCATTGGEENARDAWSSVKDKNSDITSGLSSIEMDGTVYEFMAGNTHHPKSAEIFEMLNGIQ